MKATVHVMLKPAVLDPQGEAIKKAIHNLGMTAVRSARIGKIIELDIDSDDEARARKQLEQISHDLLSNPVIENYKIEITPK